MKHRITVILTTIIGLSSLIGTAQAQFPLPAPLTSSEVIHNHIETVSSANHGVRATTFTRVTSEWRAPNQNATWDGSGITYTLSDFGPNVSGAWITEYEASQGTCTINLGGKTMDCDFGSSISGQIVVRLVITVGTMEAVDWFTLQTSDGTTDSFNNYVSDPHPYASNLVNDFSFETTNLPEWQRTGDAKQVCNKPGKIISIEGNCALRLKTSKATLKPLLSETFVNGDVIYVSWFSRSKNIAVAAKLIVIAKSISGTKSKSKWTLPTGTAAYSPWFVNKQLIDDTDNLVVRFAGGDGKLWIDVIEVFAVDFDDLN